MSTVKEEPVTTFRAQRNATKNKLPYHKRNTRQRSNRTGIQFSHISSMVARVILTEIDGDQKADFCAKNNPL